MSLAIMVFGTGGSANVLANGDFFSLLGFGNDDGASGEAFAQVSCSEAATISNLRANIISGGSGTNNFQSRKNGSNGNLLASRAGTGVAEDLTHSDSLSGGDLYDIAYTDDGSDSTCAWQSCNLLFGSGYGCIHGSANYAGVSYTTASATRFYRLAGAVLASTLEANQAWKNHAYTSWAAMQVGVVSNARVNTTTFKNRINLGDGTATCSFAAGATGLVTATGVNDAIADTNVLAISITSGSGTDVMLVGFLGGTFKSTSIKQDLWVQGSVTRAASGTAHYACPGGNFASTTALTEAQARIRPGFAGVASNLRAYLSANTYGADATLKLLKNGSAVLTTTLTAGGGAAWYENTSDSVAFTATDELSLEFKDGTSGSATIQQAGITITPSSGAPTIYYAQQRR